jgi:hypothetical protein
VLRDFAANMGQRLRDAGAVVDKLHSDGWAVKVVANNLEVRPEVRLHEKLWPD